MMSSSASPVPVVSGVAKKLCRAAIWGRLGLEAWRLHRSPRPAIATLTALARLRRTAAGGLAPKKYVVAGGRVFVSLRTPGFPSIAFDRYAAMELGRLDPRSSERGLHTAIIAITRRCALSCQHCSEWDTLRQPDPLSISDLLQIVARVRDAGAAHLQLSGGEPLLRLDAVEAICRENRRSCDIWVLTSGTPMTSAVAERLRAAGTTGAVVSLDHWDPSAHDAFRGAAGTFDRAVAGIGYASKAGLVVALSLTATRSFVTTENLERYASLARRLGVGFIQVLEPRPVGHWADADVALTEAQLSLLRAFDESINLRRMDMPIMDCPGIGQRRDGCWGAGDRYFFVDAEGAVHACPFCRGAVGSCVRQPIAVLRDRLRERGCDSFSCVDGRPARSHRLPVLEPSFDRADRGRDPVL